MASYYDSLRMRVDILNEAVALGVPEKTRKKEDTRMKWSALTFGKHEGKTLPQVMFIDPDWFYHGLEKGYFKGSLFLQAREIHRKSRAIRVPRRDGEKRFVEYIIDRGCEKFATLRVIICDAENCRPVTKNMILEVIDMRVPREFARYDKTGYHNFLFAMKVILFGDPSYKMTKRRCEEFFGNDENFELPGHEEGAQPERPETKVASEIPAEEAWACVAQWAESF